MANEPVIDSDDVPELTQEWFDGAHRGRAAARAAVANKRLVSIRLSPEVLEFYRATGEGWQTRINDTLLGIVRNAPRNEP